MRNILIFVVFLFTVPIPIVPVILWHIGKGVWEDLKKWFGTV